MFAAGRILRNNRQPSNAQPSGLLAPQRTRRKTNRKFRCYVPFMWSALMMTCIGTAIILTGVVMCFTGYYFGSFAKARVVSVSGDHLELALDIEMTSTAPTSARSSSSKMNSSMLAAVAAAEAAAASYQDHLTSKGLIYAGPVIMSFGCFAIVFACVIVCETRDRAIETIEDRIRRGLPELPADGLRPDFYELVVQYRLARLEKQRLRRIRQNAERNEEVVERERLSRCDGDGDVMSRTECERSSIHGEQIAAIGFAGAFSTHHTPDERTIDGVQADVSPREEGKPTAYRIENETDTRSEWRDAAVNGIRYNSAFSVQREQHTLGQSLPMLVRSRSNSSSQTVTPLIGTRLVSGSGFDVTLPPTAQENRNHYRCFSASSNALGDISSGTGHRKAAISTGMGKATEMQPLSIKLVPLDCSIFLENSTKTSPLTVQLVHTAHVHATVDMSDGSIERDEKSTAERLADAIEGCAPDKRGVNSMRFDDDVGVNSNEDEVNGNADITNKYCREVVHRRNSATQHNLNDDNMNVVSSTSDGSPLSVNSNLRRRKETNYKQAFYGPLFDLKSFLDQPRASSAVASSRHCCSLDELRRRATLSTACRQRHISTSQRTESSGSTSLIDNVTGRLGRRASGVLDSSAVGARQTVSSCGGSVDLLIFGAPDSTPLSDGGLSGFGESVPMTSAVAVGAHDENSDALSSSWCDLNSDIVTSPRERNANANANRRARHHSFSFTVAPRHYLSRMRAWKAKRPSGSSTGNTVVARPRSDISQLDGSTLIDCSRCDRLKDTSNSPTTDDVTIRREAQRDVTHRHRYQFPVVSFTASKTRFHPVRSARLKRPISPAVSVMQAS